MASFEPAPRYGGGTPGVGSVRRGSGGVDLAPGKQTLIDAAPGGSTGVQNGGTVQRQTDPSAMTQAQLDAALTWAATAGLGVEAIREVQGAVGAPRTGSYDEPTARGVFARERELGLGADGKADEIFFQRCGIISTRPITPAAVSDPVLTDLATRFPDGVSIAIYPAYDVAKVPDGDEFRRQAVAFAAAQGAVGLDGGGGVTTGLPCAIQKLGDIIEVVQSIHLGILQKWNRQHGAGGGGASDATGGGGGAAPAFTRVKNLALFSHGESYGMGLNTTRDFWGDGLHTDNNPGISPSNVEAFVRGLSDAVAPDVRVLLYGCYAGLGPGTDGSQRTNYTESLLQPAGDRAGVDSLADQLAQGFGPQSSVYAHSTKGPASANHSARVFGAAAGGGVGGVPLFEQMYPETFIADQLAALFPQLDDAGRTARHDSLRALMWRHYENSVHDTVGMTRYAPVLMGQEVFANPDNARMLLHADWATWIPDHLDEVSPG